MVIPLLVNGESFEWVNVNPYGIGFMTIPYYEEKFGLSMSSDVNHPFMEITGVDRPDPAFESSIYIILGSVRIVAE